jgi:hypothetical protein
LGAALFAELGLPPVIPADAFFDVFPVSVLTTSTLDRLHALRPGMRFDERRFRMNVIARTDGDGFVENDRPGHDLLIGDRVRIRIAMPDPRCVMTTLAQEDLPRGLDVLRTLVRHNRLDVAGGPYPCAGVCLTLAQSNHVDQNLQPPGAHVAMPVPGCCLPCGRWVRGWKGTRPEGVDDGADHS